MIFKFLILSDEVDSFKREVIIDADNTFLDLYKAILECTGFSDNEMASFFLCNDRWHKKQEITLIEMETSSEEDSLVMEDCVLSDYFEDEKQKLLYVFDYLTERALFIELSEISPGEHLPSPVCTLSEGNPPKQTVDFEDINMASTPLLDIGETFFGDESFDMDELDRDGFDGLDDLQISDESDFY